MSARQGDENEAKNYYKGRALDNPTTGRPWETCCKAHYKMYLKTLGEQSSSSGWEMVNQGKPQPKKRPVATRPVAHRIDSDGDIPIESSDDSSDEETN